MTPTLRALVIGGGIAGPATAMALRQAGIEATIYEADAVSADATGAFLTVASNGVDALRVLGADERALAAAFPTPSITLRSNTGKRLGSTRTGRSSDDGLVSRTIKRSDLYGALHAEALERGIAIEHGKRLVEAVEDADGVRAVFADGSTAAGDVLIGCDGVHSTVRRVIDPLVPAPTYARLLTTGGYAGGVSVESEPGSYEMIFGRRAFFGYAVAPDGEVWWFANVPRRDEPARGELEALDESDWRRRLLALFADDAGPAVELIGATRELLGTAPIHAMPHLPQWRSARMVVVGDAAHAPSPTSGQGASLSLEDALVLAKCLRDAPSVASAFARFEALRRPRVEKIIKWAARINNSKAVGPVGRVVRDAVFPAVLRLTADSTVLREAYDYHVDWDAPVLVAS
jgi:2-polyprenyl-6-methoxyphenol hydroxylase-like FAD-dependent oxidoreductase